MSDPQEDKTRNYPEQPTDHGDGAQSGAASDKFGQVIEKARQAEQAKELEKTNKREQLQKAIEEARRAAEAVELREARKVEEEKIVLAEAHRLEAAQRLDEAKQLLASARQREAQRTLDEDKDLEEAVELLAEAMRLEELRKAEEAKEVTRARQLLEESIQLAGANLPDSPVQPQDSGGAEQARLAEQAQYREQAEQLKKAILDAMQLEESQVREKAKQLEEANQLLGKAQSLARSRGLDIAQKLEETRKLEESKKQDEPIELMKSRHSGNHGAQEKQISKPAENNQDLLFTTEEQIREIIAPKKEKKKPSTVKAQTASYSSLEALSQRKLAEKPPVPKDSKIFKHAMIAVVAAVALGIVGALAGEAFLIFQAQKLYDQGDYRGALKSADQALILASSSSSLHALRGAIHMKEPLKAEEAFKDYDLALKAEPSNQQYLKDHATVALQTGRNEAAISDLGRLLSQKPAPREEAVFLAQKAKGEENLNELVEADDDLTSAIQLQQGKQPLLTQRGWVRLARNKPRLAIDDFHAAILLDPKSHDSAWAHVGSAVAYQALSDTAKATSCFAESMQIDDKNPDAYVQRGLFFASQKKSELAQADFDKAINLDKACKAAYIEKAKLEAQQGKFANALAELDGAMSTCQQLTDLYIARAKIYEQKKDFKNAADQVSKALASGIHNADLYVDLAYYDGQLKSFKAAIEAIEQALAIRPSDANLTALHGYYNYRMGNSLTARTDFDQAIEADPKNASAYFWRGELVADKSEYLSAEADIKHALALNPNLEEARKKLDEIDKNIAGKRAVASKQSSTQDPIAQIDTETLLKQPVKGDFNTLLNSGYAKLEARDDNGAIKYLAGAIRLNPNDPRARRYLAHAFMLRDETSLAIEQFRALIKLSGSTPGDLSALADLLVKAEQLDEAVTILEKCLKENPRDPRARCQLAEAYLADGDRSKATELLTQGIKTDPANEERYSAELRQLAEEATHKTSSDEDR